MNQPSNNEIRPSKVMITYVYLQKNNDQTNGVRSTNDVKVGPQRQQTPSITRNRNVSLVKPNGATLKKRNLSKRNSNSLNLEDSSWWHHSNPGNDAKNKDHVANLGFGEELNSSSVSLREGGQSSPQVFNIHEDRTPLGLPTGLFRIENHSANIKNSANDYPLETFRTHLNGYQDKQSRNPAAPVKPILGGHIRSVSPHQNISSLSLNRQFGVRDDTPTHHPISSNLTAHLSSVFDDSGSTEEDILTMAAHRDQQRGGARFVRGLMGPISNKNGESLNKMSAVRSGSRQRVKSAINDSQLIQTVNIGQTIQSKGRPFIPTRLSSEEGINRTGTPHRTPSSNLILGFRKTIPQSNDFLNNPQNDILAQSVRRQTLKGTKHSLSESNLGNIAEVSGSNLGLELLNQHSGKDSEKFRSEPNGLNKVLTRRSSVIPSSHEDIQILNLHGFMDFPKSGISDNRTNDSKKKHKKRRSKGPETSTKSRDRKRRNRNRKGETNLSDDDEDDLVLKDLDDIDDKISGLVLGPNVFKDSTGSPITVEDASKLRSLLVGSPAQTLPTEWMAQNFLANPNPNLSYGLIQKKGGPCGVLASVQAHMLKALMFGSYVSSEVTPVSPLRPSNREWAWALSVAMTEILWRAGGNQEAILALPGSFAQFEEHGIGRYNRDGITETLILHNYNDAEDLYKGISKYLTIFTSTSSPGCVLLLYSVLLSRGLETVETDVDEGSGHLINMHGYASQEIVNLLITGRASTNTFNGDQTLQNDNDETSDKMTLKGTQNRSEIGLLSLFEHYGSCKVGSNLKTPSFPIWVVCSESHYSCLFSRDKSATSDYPRDRTFHLYFYDGLALQEDEIKLTIDVTGTASEAALIPPLEHCIRTKWHDASIDWNGTDPIL